MKTGKVVFLVFPILLSLCVVNIQPVKAAEAVENSWTIKAPLTKARDGLEVAVVNGKIYAIGGENDSGYLATNEEYDPVTDTWATKKPMPTPRADFGIAVYQNKIYAMGGQIGFDWSGAGRSILCSSNEVYDPSSDTWTTRVQMPTAREEFQANVVGGKIYLIGGLLPSVGTSLNLSNLNEVYDPETDSWTNKATLPTTAYGHASTVVNDKIYVISGFDCNLNQIYDPETNTWSNGAPIPTAVSMAVAGATSGIFAPKRIYVIGGYPSYDECNLNQAYDPEENTWSSGATMPTSRRSVGVAVVNDVLYAIGGGSNNLNVRQYAENEQYTPYGFGNDPYQSEPFPIEYVYGIVSVAAVSVAGVAGYLFMKRKKQSRNK